MKIISFDPDGIVEYLDPRGLIIHDSTEYYKSKGFSLEDSVVVACPHCHSILGDFPNIEAAITTEIAGTYTCQYGHIFCQRCVPDWRESGEPYCAVCQDAAHERFFSLLAERGIDYALTRFDPAASQLALYRACRERGLDVAYRRSNVYPVRGKGDSLVFYNVSLYRSYLPFLCQLFFVDDNELQELGMSGVSSPQDFARLMEHRPFEDWCGGAGFGTFETPSGRGWVYRTIYDRRLYFVPSLYVGYGTLYCVGLDDSTEFRRRLAEAFGVPRRENLPEIGEIVWLQRPVVDDGELVSVPDNKQFWAVAR
jgi:hypothetical protein